MAIEEEINVDASTTHNQDEAIRAINRLIEDTMEDRAPQPSSYSSPPLHRVPERLRKAIDYDKYYVPKVVSIGPYHHGNPKLESFEKLKPRFLMELLMKNNTPLIFSSLYEKLGEANMVQDLRTFYEEKATDHLSDEVFTQIMLLDGCFILYFIRFLYGETRETIRVSGSHDISLIFQDLFLLENQIPFKVLKQVMNVIDFDNDMIESFVTEKFLGLGRQKRVAGWFSFGTDSSTQNDENDHDHLLHRLYCTLTRTSIVKTQKFPNIYTGQKRGYRVRRTFHSVNELIDMGIHFKASSSMYLDNVEYVGRCWWFSADLKLPSITMDKLLNLLAYEMCSYGGYDSWVISYICLLDSLIDQPEDVKALRNAGVLDDPLGNESDEKVAKMFNEISIRLVPNTLAYSKVKKQIQSHYDKWRSIHLTEFKHDYLKTPWSTLALVGAVIIFFL